MNRKHWSSTLFGIALVTLALAGRAPSAHAYDQVQYISRSYGPSYVAQYYPGWVIGGLSGLNNSLYMLQYIGDGQWGKYHQAWNVYPDISPTPPGWVIYGTGGSFKNMQCVVNAPYLTTLQVLTTSPVPANWVFLSVSSPTMMIRNVTGALYPAQQTVWYTSPLPPNWVVLSASGTSKSILCVVGASSGTVLQVAPTSPVPAGWTVTYRDIYTMQIRKN